MSQRLESEFFEIADDLSAAGLPPITKTQTHILEIPPHSLLGQIDPSVVRFQEFELGGNGSTIVLSSSPEAEITAGVGGFTADGKFVLPRLHTGVPAQIDLQLAVWQLAHSPHLEKLIRQASSSPSGIIKFTREGHLTDLQKVIWQMTRVTIPTTIATSKHRDADNPFGREPYLPIPVDLEGFPQHLEILFHSDPAAAGMQHIETLTHLLSRGYSIDQVVVVAPIASRYGLTAIELFCRRYGLGFTAATCAALLDSIPPEMYYSPYPTSPEMVVDPTLHQFAVAHFAPQIHQWCIGGNWTMRYLGTAEEHAKASAEELSALGLTVPALWRLCAGVTLEETSESGLASRLLPYSSLL